jgi:hypothetical protein
VEFTKIPGSPVAYWISKKLLDAFCTLPRLSEFGTTRLGMTTANNDLFTKAWHEISIKSLSIFSGNEEDVSQTRKKWVPYNKGGLFRKWYGNLDTVVNCENNGEGIKQYGASGGKIRSTVPNSDFYFKECITWSKVSIGQLAMRNRPAGSIFDVAGACIFGQYNNLLLLLGIANSKVTLTDQSINI